jgi:hypothetical protein
VALDQPRKSGQVVSSRGLERKPVMIEPSLTRKRGTYELASFDTPERTTADTLSAGWQRYWNDGRAFQVVYAGRVAPPLSNVSANPQS